MELGSLRPPRGDRTPFPMNVGVRFPREPGRFPAGPLVVTLALVNALVLGHGERDEESNIHREDNEE